MKRYVTPLFFVFFFILIRQHFFSCRHSRGQNGNTCFHITCSGHSHNECPEQASFNKGDNTAQIKRIVWNLQQIRSCYCPAMHNIFQPLSSVALLQQCRQHYLKEKQLKWKLADWDLATKTNKTNHCTTECTCKSTSFRWVKGGEGRGRAPKKMLSTLR